MIPSSFFTLPTITALGLIASYRDIKDGWIPDWTTVALGILGVSFAYETGVIPESLLSALLLGLMAYVLRLMFHGRGMGWGDVKLLAATGLWVLPEKIPVVLIACGLLGVISHILWTVVKHLNHKRLHQWQNTFPFAPSIYGALVFYLWFYG